MALQPGVVNETVVLDISDGGKSRCWVFLKTDPSSSVTGGWRFRDFGSLDPIQDVYERIVDGREDTTTWRRSDVSTLPLAKG